MIHFKNLNTTTGFSIIEVMLALFMLASVLSALLYLQNSSMRNVGYSTHKLRYLFDLKNALFDAQLKRVSSTPPKTEKKEGAKKTGATITYVITPVAKESSLKNIE